MSAEQDQGEVKADPAKLAEIGRAAGTKKVPHRASGGILPKRGAHDAAYTWGDKDDSAGHDEWLKENRPPHWG